MATALDFTGKVAVVVGGTSGINRGIARCFAAHGATVAVASRKQGKVDETVNELRALGAQAMGFSADVREPDALEAGMQAVHERFGDFDVVVSGAAGNFPALANDLSWNGFKTVIDIDLRGTFHVMKAVFPRLRKPGASVINPLLARLQGTRNETALAICRRAVLTALLAHDDLNRARPLAQVGWRQTARFPLLAHAAWPDLLALLAALERRPRAAAKLLGVGDAGWTRIGRQRGATTRTTVQRAESGARSALGDETFAQLRRDGTRLRDEDVDALAFAAADAS